jgi:hypothetical protein
MNNNRSKTPRVPNEGYQRSRVWRLKKEGERNANGRQVGGSDKSERKLARGHDWLRHVVHAISMVSTVRFERNKVRREKK